MITNTTKAEELIRREVNAANQQIAAIDQEVARLTQRRQQMVVVVEEWGPCVADDPQPEPVTPEA